LHWVVQVLASCVRQVSKLLSWHCSWQLAFALPVHSPEQSALHFVVQSAVVGTETQVVVQWSSQQALHEAWQSAEADAEAVDPSGPDEDEDDELALHEVVQLEPQRELQSVVQSIAGGLAVHLVEQSD